MSTDVFQMSERHGMNWFTTIILVLFHIGAIAALFMFSWRSLAVAIFLYWMATGLGISMGYHRLHTHRSYKVPLLARVFLRRLRRVDAGRRTRSSGWPRTAFIIRSPISRATRIRLATAPGGRTWAGFSSARPTTTTPG